MDVNLKGSRQFYDGSFFSGVKTGVDYGSIYEESTSTLGVQGGGPFWGALLF